MDGYLVVEFANGYLSIVGLIAFLFFELLIGGFIGAFVQDYEQKYRLPLFFLMFSSMSLLFIMLISSMGWWIYYGN
jgi:hypothetical protein